MKTFIYGAGPIGSLYAYLFHKAGVDVTILARNEHYNFIKKNGLILQNEFSGERLESSVRVVKKLKENDVYDLVIVAIRKNKLAPIFPILAKNKNIKHILFFGNNVTGFEEYFENLPKEKVLFGFPGAGGGRKNHIIHYVDSEKPKAKRLPVTIGEPDGKIKERTKEICKLFKTSGIPVNLEADIDGWLKYHAAMILPTAGAMYMNDSDNYKLAADKKSLYMFLHAFKEAGNVLKKIGYVKRQPFKYNFFYWMPESLVIKIAQKVFSSRFAEIAFALHLEAAGDEIRELANEFNELVKSSGIEIPVLNKLFSFIP